MRIGTVLRRGLFEAAVHAQETARLSPRAIGKSVSLGDAAPTCGTCLSNQREVLSQPVCRSPQWSVALLCA